MGVVCTIAAYSVIFEAVGLFSLQQPAGQDSFKHSSIDVPSVATAAAPALTPLQTEDRANLARGQAVKTTLPRIGSQVALPGAATDGRGGDAPVTVPGVIRGDTEPTRPPAREASTPDAMPAATTQPLGKPSKPMVQKKRERPSSYASEYRQGPSYRGVSQTASWY